MAAEPDIIGQVVAAHGRHYVVELPDGSHHHCFPRGKRSLAAVGDFVNIAFTGHDEGIIERILPRKNVLFRSDDMRSKLFATNVDQLFIVVATEPPFSVDLVSRALVAAFTAGIAPVIILNKADIAEGLAAARQQLDWVDAIGVEVITLSAIDTEHTKHQLLDRLANKTTLLLGQSAMGKSTILNSLVPHAQATTQEHSRALGAGRHTTTTTRLYRLPEHQASLIDSPGFQTFGLHHLDADDLITGFPEFLSGGHTCRFYNCSHRHEPGCDVIARLERGDIVPHRHALYKRLLSEQERKTHY
ncbi:MAG TPA: ribosome small subunit-dependent GTPase A [Burkholderiaceae bacterium]|nr:ribosome small subunit-dependent GTPase A [Burkholderiaceae bacterium]